MACVILCGPNGERAIPEGRDGNCRYVLQLGESILRVESNCEGEVREPADEVTALISELDIAFGEAGLGEWIKVFAEPVARSLGQSGCTGCQVRRIVADAYAPLRKVYGRLGATKIVAGLIRRSFTEPGLDILRELKELCCKSEKNSSSDKDASG